MIRPRFASNRKPLPKQRLRRGRAQCHDQCGTHDLNLRVEPWLARADFDRSRLGMDSPLTPLDEFEMLDRVGNIDVVRRDSGTFHRVMKQLSSRADEWMAEPVFAVAGLLPNEHHSRA